MLQILIVIVYGYVLSLSYISLKNTQLLILNMNMT